MASKEYHRLAQTLKHTPLVKGGAFGGAAAVGMIDDFPVAVAWTKMEKQATAAFLVCFRNGSLKVSPDEMKKLISSSPEILAAMDKKQLSSGEMKSLAVDEGSLVLFWHYSFRTPKPEAAADVLRHLVRMARENSQPVGTSCEVCQRQRGELFCVDGVPTVVCAGCREQMGEEDRRRIEAYEALASNPAIGTLAGILAAGVMAGLWGGVAYAINRIFLYGAVLIGIVIAWTVNKGMGKINLYGRVLTVILTLVAVVAGDYLFFLLSFAKEMNVPINSELAITVMNHFIEIEFAEASGFLSMLFGVIGAIYILYVNRPPVAKRSLIPVDTALHSPTS